MLNDLLKNLFLILKGVSITQLLDLLYEAAKALKDGKITEEEKTFLIEKIEYIMKKTGTDKE